MSYYLFSTVLTFDSVDEPLWRYQYSSMVLFVFQDFTKFNFIFLERPFQGTLCDIHHKGHESH